MRKHIREKLIRETGLFLKFDLMKSRRICIAKGFFTLYPKICSKSRLKSAKNPLPVYVRRSKTTTLLNLKIMTEKWPPSKLPRTGVTCVGEIISMELSYYWQRSEGIQLRSPTLIIANLIAIGTRVPTHGLAILVLRARRFLVTWS